MKFATLRLDGQTRVVALDPQRSVFWLAGEVFPGLPSQASVDMAVAIANLPSPINGLVTQGPGQRLDPVTLWAPLPNPPHNVMCVGKNYCAHAREFTQSGFDSSAAGAAEAIPEYPIIFTKPASAIAGPRDDIPLFPGLDAAVDYEAELAVVIGRGGRFIPRSQAMQHVFGYMVLNDVTARDLQRQHKRWFLGKGIDGFCPMGPWITTADEVNAADLRVTCHVNGELRQDGVRLT